MGIDGARLRIGTTGHRMTAIAGSAALYAQAASSPERLTTAEEALFDRAMALADEAIALDPSYAD